MQKTQSVTLCGETFTGPMHICAFFDSKEEQYDILLPWLEEGIDNKEEVLTILASDCHSEHCSRLTEAGIPVGEAMARGQLKVVATEDTYLQGNSFAADRMLNTLEKAIKDAQDGPYGMLRGHGDMEWALKNLPGTDELIEYETRINMLTPKYDCTILCSYDINKFSGRAVADIIASHLYVILNGKIHRNPHFVNPIDLLQILMKRPKRPLSRNAE